MRSPLNWVLILVLVILSCDQPPTSIEEEPYREPAPQVGLQAEISSFQYDPLFRMFSFSVDAASDVGSPQVNYTLSTSSTWGQGQLSDDGSGADILVQDGVYNGSWLLPDSLDAELEMTWTLAISVTDGQNSLDDEQSLAPQRPEAAQILSVSHADTLTLHPSAWVVDTLRVLVDHPQGLDEIRDVSLLSLKPDGTYANGGQPIPLYDDGGQEVFYSFDGVDFTSGDKVANDGEYALLLILTPGNLAGTYEWSFTARTWLGITSEVYADTLIVLDGAGRSDVAVPTTLQGVFK